MECTPRLQAGGKHHVQQRPGVHNSCVMCKGVATQQAGSVAPPPELLIAVNIYHLERNKPPLSAGAGVGAANLASRRASERACLPETET